MCHAVNCGGSNGRQRRGRAECGGGAAGGVGVVVVDVVVAEVGGRFSLLQVKLLLVGRDRFRALWERRHAQSDLSHFQPYSSPNHVPDRSIHSPFLRANRCCLPFSISSSSLRYLSLSSRSLFSDSSRTDFRKAAGSRSSSAAFSVVLVVLECDAANGDCWGEGDSAMLCRGDAAFTAEEAII